MDSLFFCYLVTLFVYFWGLVLFYSLGLDALLRLCFFFEKELKVRWVRRVIWWSRICKDLVEGKNVIKILYIYMSYSTCPASLRAVSWRVHDKIATKSWDSCSSSKLPCQTCVFFLCRDFCNRQSAWNLMMLLSCYEWAEVERTSLWSPHEKAGRELSTSAL